MFLAEMGWETGGHWVPRQEGTGQFGGGLGAQAQEGVEMLGWCKLAGAGQGALQGEFWGS